MKKILGFFNENHWQAITVLIVVIMFFWLYGCQSKVASTTDSKQMITRTMLQGEIEAYLAIAKSKMKTLDEEDALRKTVLDNAALLSASGAVNPLGVLNSVISILAIGSAVDSKNKVKKLTKKQTDNT